MDTQNNQQLAKQERRELRRQEKQQSHMSQQKKQASKRTIRLMLIILIIGASGYGLYYLASSPEKASKPGETFPILGRDHIQNGAEHPAYNSNPPTSGWHYVQPAEWGVYQNELPDEQLIHNLEHGGIWISYKDVDEKTRSDLEAIGKKYSGSVVITPRSANDAKITLASWGRLEKFDSFNEKKITDFIKVNKNKSPEPLAR